VEHHRRQRGDLEHQILAVLASADAAMTAAEVREALDPALAYNTVLTVISRLYDKGEVTRQLAGRAHAYRAVTDRATVTAWRMQRLLDGDDDRAAVLARFHGALSPQDTALLAALIASPEDPREDT
jgi:predicted transcriptional regulator